MSEENTNLETQAAPETEVKVEAKVEDTRDVVARELDKAEASAEKVRDDKGKFAQKEGAIKVPEAKEDKPDTDANTDNKEVEKPKERATDIYKSFSKEERTVIGELPPEVQKILETRQDRFFKGIEQYKADANFAKTIQKAVAPHAEYMAQLGVTPDIALANLLTTERKLRTGSEQEKSQLFQQLAHDYGIDLWQLSQVPFDRNQYQLQQELTQLKSQLGNVQASRQSAEDVQIEQTIADFAQSHEYYDEVSGHMADLLNSGFATTLDDAYAKAVRLNDDVFNRFSASQQQDQQRQQALKADQAAKAAKAVAVSVKGAPTGITHNPNPTTTEEAVRQAMRQHGIL